MEKQATTIVENIKKEGQKFIAIIEPIEIEGEVISEVAIPSDMDIKVGDAVVVEKKRGRFVIKKILLDLQGEENTEEGIETKALVLEEESPPTYYETEERGIRAESKTKSILKKFLKGAGIGGLVVGGGILFILFNILHFLFTAVVGLGMIGWAISEFLKGSIIIGLLVLLIGTPLAIGLAHWFFFFWLILMILAVIVWGASYLFGFGVSFGGAWEIAWFIIKILILGCMAFVGITGFIEAIREKKIFGFFKEYWWGILLFCFLFWLFFL